jgi:hypothetical protein
MQSAILSNTGLMINSVVTFVLAILSIFYYRRFLPNIHISHLRFVTFDDRYVDVRITIRNHSQGTDSLDDTYLKLPDKRKLFPIPESILKAIKVTDNPTYTLNLDDFILLNQESNNYDLIVRSGTLLELPLFIKPYETIKARFVFDALHVKPDDITASSLVLRLPHRKKTYPLFTATKKK